MPTINLTGSDGSPGKITFTGSSYALTLEMLSASGVSVRMLPDTDDATALLFGSTTYRLKGFTVVTTGVGFELQDRYDLDTYLDISTTANSTTQRLLITARHDSSTLATLKVYSSSSTQYVEIDSVLKIIERSSDPAEPSEGECVIWMSDGTGKGDDGDVMIASQAGGTTNYGTLFDHSGGAGW